MIDRPDPFGDRPDPDLWRDFTRYPSRGFRLGKYEKRSIEQIERVIIHHTGVGILGRFKRDKDRFGWTIPIQAAIHAYTRIMASSGHYVIGHEGQVVQFVPENYSAWHAGYGGRRRRSRLGEWFAKTKYTRKLGKRPRWVCRRDGRFDWWDVRWRLRQGITSPLAWFPDLDTNGHTIGIELLSTPRHEPFTSIQLRSLRTLVVDICMDYGIPIDNHHILTHSDANPLARTTRRGVPYDPPASKYSFQAVFG